MVDVIPLAPFDGGRINAFGYAKFTSSLEVRIEEGDFLHD